MCTDTCVFLCVCRDCAHMKSSCVYVCFLFHQYPGYQAGATKVKKVLLNTGGAAGRRCSMPELTDLSGCLAQHAYMCMHTRNGFASCFHARARTHTHSLTHALTCIRVCNIDAPPILRRISTASRLLQKVHLPPFPLPPPWLSISQHALFLCIV